RRSHHRPVLLSFHSFFSAPPTPASYTLSLHDALPIFGEKEPALEVRGESRDGHGERQYRCRRTDEEAGNEQYAAEELSGTGKQRSEEHTSELQSRENLVCRLLLEKKKHQKQSSDGRPL